MSWYDAKFEVNEYVGLAWQPKSDIDFYIEDIRIVNEMVSGKSWVEYKVARRDYQDKTSVYSTGWHTEDKLFKVDQSLAIVNR
jgi:hypothetical protein